MPGLGSIKYRKYRYAILSPFHDSRNVCYPPSVTAHEANCKIINDYQQASDQSFRDKRVKKNIHAQNGGFPYLLKTRSISTASSTVGLDDTDLEGTLGDIFRAEGDVNCIFPNSGGVIDNIVSFVFSGGFNFHRYFLSLAVKHFDFHISFACILGVDFKFCWDTYR